MTKYIEYWPNPTWWKRYSNLSFPEIFNFTFPRGWSQVPAVGQSPLSKPPPALISILSYLINSWRWWLLKAQDKTCCWLHFVMRPQSWRWNVCCCYRGKLRFEQLWSKLSRTQLGRVRSEHDYKQLNIDCGASLQILPGILTVYFALQGYCS